LYFVNKNKKKKKERKERKEKKRKEKKRKEKKRKEKKPCSSLSSCSPKLNTAKKDMISRK